MKAEVPCNGCVACCRGQRIMLTEEEARSGQYIMEPCKPDAQMLAHKSNGDCWYLGPLGCTIHNRSPKVCREFDCRVWLKSFAEKDWSRLGPLDQPTVRAAMERF